MLNCKDIIILLVYGFVLFKVLKPNQTKEMILLTIGAYMLLTYEGFEGFTEDDTEEVDDSSSNLPVVNPANISTNRVTNDGGTIKKPIIEKGLSMGPYDGVCLKTGNKEYWMKSPDNTSLLPNDELYSYLGSQGPVKMRLSDQAALIGPPIDGVKGSAEKKFMFANNKASLACCPSTFSTSTGCICTTENQRDFINGRGIIDGDKSKNSEI